jgi:hypothetical protein
MAKPTGDRAPACELDLCWTCDGNVDCLVQGVIYHRYRCSCKCHPSGIREVHWPSSSK